jgi:hypothetical protein
MAKNEKVNSNNNNNDDDDDDDDNSSVVRVREPTLPTHRRPLVGVVSANF